MNQALIGHHHALRSLSHDMKEHSILFFLAFQEVRMRYLWNASAGVLMFFLLIGLFQSSLATSGQGGMTCGKRISESSIQDTFANDKGQKSAISGRRPHWNGFFFPFLQVFCAIQ